VFPVLAALNNSESLPMSVTCSGTRAQTYDSDRNFFHYKFSKVMLELAQEQLQ